MNNHIDDVLYRKRAAHIGTITAKLSIAAVIFTVIIGAGMVVHQMLAALLLMLWLAVTICFVGLLLLDPVWRSVPGQLLGSMDFVAELFDKVYGAFYPLAIIAIVCAVVSIGLGFIESDRKPVGRMVLCGIALAVAVITLIAVGGTAA